MHLIYQTPVTSTETATCIVSNSRGFQQSLGTLKMVWAQPPFEDVFHPPHVDMETAAAGWRTPAPNWPWRGSVIAEMRPSMRDGISSMTEMGGSRVWSCTVVVFGCLGNVHAGSIQANL